MASVPTTTQNQGAGTTVLLSPQRNYRITSTHVGEGTLSSPNNFPYHSL